MGAKNQENEENRAVAARSRDVVQGEGPRTSGVPNGLRQLGAREAIASPLTPSETVGFGPKGAKVGADLRPHLQGPAYAEKFWSRVDRSGSCWLWTRAKNGDGYGVAMCGRRENGKPRLGLTHRIAFELAKGPVPAGLELDHTCKRRLCCNPDHLEAVEHSENCRRSDSGRCTAERNRQRAAARKEVSA